MLQSKSSNLSGLFSIKNTQQQKEDSSQKQNEDTSLYNEFFKNGGLIGDVISDRGSTFQAHAISITNMGEFNRNYQCILSNIKVKKATHNIMAYRIKKEDQSSKDKDKDKEMDKEVSNKKVTKKNKKVEDSFTTEGFDDDGEDSAGIRLLGLLQKMKVVNIMVIVSRWFGGTLLGLDRFKHINDSAQILISDNRTSFQFAD